MWDVTSNAQLRMEKMSHSFCRLLMQKMVLVNDHCADVYWNTMSCSIRPRSQRFQNVVTLMHNTL
jgi:hypothetical protein